jgi:hypothetical protein
MPHPSRAETPQAGTPRPGAGVTHCPGCGASLDNGAAFVQEFWAGDDRNFLCWCPGCGLLCTVVISARLVSYEPEH